MALCTGFPAGTGHLKPLESSNTEPKITLKCLAQSDHFERKLRSHFRLSEELLTSPDPQPQSALLHTLPPELLLAIFSTLPGAPSQIALALTCKLLADLTSRTPLTLSTTSAQYAGFLPRGVFDVPALMVCLRDWGWVDGVERGSEGGSNSRNGSENGITVVSGLGKGQGKGGQRLRLCNHCLTFRPGISPSPSPAPTLRNNIDVSAGRSVANGESGGENLDDKVDDTVTVGTCIDDYWARVEGCEISNFWIQKTGWVFGGGRWNKIVHDICPKCHSTCSLSDYVDCDGCRALGRLGEVDWARVGDSWRRRTEEELRAGRFAT